MHEQYNIYIYIYFYFISKCPKKFDFDIRWILSGCRHTSCTMTQGTSTCSGHASAMEMSKQSGSSYPSDHDVRLSHYLESFAESAYNSRNLDSGRDSIAEQYFTSQKWSILYASK